MNFTDTIFAVATARGKAGVAIIRLSGPRAWKAGETLSGPLPKPRQTSLRRLVDAKLGFLDQALVICFESRGSFTGEQVCELHLHGSIATTSATLSALGVMPGLRMAEPGEFTRRALENGVLDVAQIEGLSDLLEAETEAQRLQALRVFSGALGEKVDSWRQQLIRAVSLLEATIDFADEDVPVDVRPEVLSLLSTVYSDLTLEIVGSHVSERIRDGFEVAIVGPPNIGKSTLLNRLAGREAALTSEVAGTTRDVIEVRMDLSGLPVTFLDTAGLRKTSDKVESLGIERAIERADRADLRIFLTPDGDVSELGVAKKTEDLVVIGKADKLSGITDLAVSGKVGTGVDALIAKVTGVLSSRVVGAATAMRARHRIAMESAVVGLESANQKLMDRQYVTELAAEDLYRAIRSLDSMIGRVDVEHVLDEIFANFCLGK